MARKRKKPEKREKPEPCMRALAAQWRDLSRSHLRANHPPDALARFDAMSPTSLEKLTADHPRSVEEIRSGREAFHARALEMAKELALHPWDQRARLDDEPIATVIVCAHCGKWEAVVTTRPWAVSDKMKDTGLPEWEVLAADELYRRAMEETEGPARTREGGDLWHLSAGAIRMLRDFELAGTDLETVRAAMKVRNAEEAQELFEELEEEEEEAEGDEDEES